MTTLSSIYNSPGGGGSSADELVKISATDTTAQYLEDALVKGTGVTLTKNNSGGNETITIAASGGGSTTTVSAGANISVNQVGNDYSISTHAADLIASSNTNIKTYTSYIDGKINNTSCLFLTNTTVSLGYNAFRANDKNELAIGAYALQNLNTAYSSPGTENIAIGYLSLGNLTSGSQNTSIGIQSLYSVVSGSRNLALGNNSGSSIRSDKSYNIALGYYALSDAGQQIGWEAGNGNVCLGSWAVSDMMNGGSNNTFIGHAVASGGGEIGTNPALVWPNSLNYSSGFTGSNNIAIGYFATPSSGAVSNEITLGNSSITSLRCAVTSITSLSDIRDKADITQLPIGLDFINSLNPVTYRWDKREWYENGERDGSKKQEKLQAGFIAQELQESQAEFNADYLNLVYDSNPNKLEATPGNLLFVLVNAVKELSSKLEAVEAELATLKASKKRSTKAGAQ